MRGFTLTIDGDPDACKRILDAAYREIEAVWREDDERREATWLGIPPMRYYLSGLRSVTGKIETRGTLAERPA